MDRSPNSASCASSRTCEVCDGADFAPLADRDRHGQPLATDICRGCGMISHRSIPSEAELTAFYSRDYRKQYHREDTPNPVRVVRDWRRGRRLFEELSPLLSSGARVFEIGAGVGCNLKHFDLAGYDASGIEPGSGFQAFSRETLRARIDVGRIEDLSATPQFDLVLLVHVIEHLRSPREALRKIHSLLKPGGRAYIECPNIAAPHAPPGKLFHFAHIHNFTPATLPLLARRCGLRVERAISRGDDRYLQFAFRRAEPRDVVIPPGLYEQTVAAVNRYGTLGYHLRRKYLAYRAESLADYLSAKLGGRPEYEQIVSLCSKTERSGRQVRRAA